MKVNTYLCVDVKTIMHENALQLSQKPCNGQLIMDGQDHFRFEETLRKPAERNPHIFSGKYCSLTHRKDGKYLINVKPVDPDDVDTPETLVVNLIPEILAVAKIITA